MKRIAAALVLFFWSSFAVAAGWLPLAYATRLTGTFYVSSAGSDGNPGTISQPWQTIAHVAAQRFGPNTTILFNGGDTFTETSAAHLAFTPATAQSGLTVSNYGTGQPTISADNSTAPFKATNIAAGTISNIIWTGGGNTTSVTDCIGIVNSQSGNTKLAGWSVTGNTISGCGRNGVSIEGASGSSGFNNTTITNNTIHDVSGNSTDSFGTSCIFVFSKTDYGSGATTPAHINGTITGNTVYNCTGTNGAGMTNWSGSGIIVSQSRGFAIGGCPTCGNLVHDFGVLNNGPFEPGGAWSADADQITISYNEVYNGLTGPAGNHPDCGGFDGGQTNSSFDHNKCHDNAGVGMTGENYFDGTCCTTWGNNTYAFNLLQNNLKDQASTGAEILFLFSAAATNPAYVYNNTVVQSRGGAAIGDVASSTQAYTLKVANNIFAVNNGGKFTNFTHPSTDTFIGNDYYSYGTTATWAWNGTTYTNASLATAFAAWQTATSQEKISGSNVGLTSNPSLYVPGGLFATTGYLPLQDMADNLQSGSPMIGAGQNVTTQFGITPLSTDYYGTGVTASTLPVGAAAGDFATFAASCTPATNYLARVSSFAKADDVIYNSGLCSANAKGIMAHLDVWHHLAAPNSAASLLNLVSTSFSLVSHGTNTFTAGHGYVSNGTTGYLDTQYTPSTAGGHMTLASGSLGAYDLTGGVDSKCIIGATNNTTTEISVFVYLTSGGGPGMYADVNDFTGAVASNVFANAKGFFVGQRLSGSDNLWRNGVNPHSNVVATVALTPDSVFVQAENTAGSPTTISTDQIAMDFLGDGSVDMVEFPLIVNSMMMAYGINVY